MSHAYAVRLTWRGDTGAGYAAYDRTHEVTLPPAEGTLDVSADAAFRGDPALPNPESLLLAAASSCQMLSFLALAARAGISVRAYEDDADAILDLEAKRQRMDQIVLQPRITVDASVARETVLDLVRAAHETCYIANTLAVDIEIVPTIVRSPTASV